MSSPFDASKKHVLIEVMHEKKSRSILNELSVEQVNGKLSFKLSNEFQGKILIHRIAPATSDEDDLPDLEEADLADLEEPDFAYLEKADSPVCVQKVEQKCGLPHLSYIIRKPNPSYCARNPRIPGYYVPRMPHPYGTEFVFHPTLTDSSVTVTKQSSESATVCENNRTTKKPAGATMDNEQIASSIQTNDSKHHSVENFIESDDESGESDGSAQRDTSFQSEKSVVDYELSQQVYNF